MKPSRVIFLLLFLFVQDVIQAQDVYYEAGYILQQQDTIPGYIKMINETELSLSVSFKENKSAVASKSYSPEQITGFGFRSSGLHYSSVVVDVSRNSAILSEHRFAKNLVAGEVALYKMHLTPEEQQTIYLKDNTYKYIIEKEGQFITLEQREFRSGDRVGINKIYLGKLKVLLGDCLNAENDINDKLQFKDNSMIALIKRYNHCKNPEAVTLAFATKRKSIIKYGMELSYNKIFLPTSDQVVNSRGYSIGYFWEVNKPHLNRILSGKFGINYLYLHYDFLDKRRNNTIPVAIHYIRIPIQGQFNFHKSLYSKVFPFINLGITPQISSDSKISFVDTIPFLTAGAGLYMNRFKFAIAVDNRFTVDYRSTTPRNDKILSFLMGYRLDQL